MKCKFCGNKLDDTATFCPNCGKLVEQVEDAISNEPQPEYQNPINEKKKSALGRQILANAIVGLVLGLLAFVLFSTFGTMLIATENFKAAFDFMVVSLPINIVGLCFTGSAKAKIKQFAKTYTNLNGAAKTGRGFSIPASIINIITVVFQALFFIFICVMLYL